MKPEGILNPEISELVARMGHGDRLTVTDRGFPLPLNDDVSVVDVSVGPNLPKMVDVVDVILNELEIEEVIIAEETEQVSPEIHKQLMKMVNKLDNKGNDIKVSVIPHPKFKHLVLRGAEEGEEMKGMVRTGELTPYANIMLVSGVTF
ncbi:D-ribose pyranase [Candidatus Bipolaricaulota bacterium]|nr:D-ribose pyranase [Candidatus Bipolaricaulota bacterium]